MKFFLLYVPIIYRPFIIPALAGLVIIVLTSLSGPFLLGQINGEFQKVKELKLENSKLEVKKQILDSINKNDLLAKTNSAVDAVPGQAPTLPALSSTNMIARDNNVVLTDFKVEEKNDSIGSTLIFNVNFEGTFQNTFRFLKNFKNISPLLQVTGISTSAVGGLAKTKVSLLSLWAPLPTNIGQIAASIEPLTSSEKEISAKLSALKKSGFQIQSITNPSRTNPFSSD